MDEKAAIISKTTLMISRTKTMGIRQDALTRPDPHCGHLKAPSDMRAWHSGQLMIAMKISLS
jgi:hypothetical protein